MTTTPTTSTGTTTGTTSTTTTAAPRVIDIEGEVIADFSALLAAAGLANVYPADADIGEVGPYYVTVRAAVTGDAFAGANGGPSGYFTVAVDIAVHRIIDGDATGAELRSKVADVRGVILDSALPANLRAVSANMNYHGWDSGRAVPSVEGRWRIFEIPLTMYANPSTEA